CFLLIIEPASIIGMKHWHNISLWLYIPASLAFFFGLVMFTVALCLSHVLSLLAMFRYIFILDAYMIHYLDSTNE
ncbi:hypothetical protein ACJX0J_025676, partial [Zea mays]